MPSICVTGLQHEFQAADAPLTAAKAGAIAEVEKTQELARAALAQPSTGADLVPDRLCTVSGVCVTGLRAVAHWAVDTTRVHAVEYAYCSLYMALSDRRCVD